MAKKVRVKINRFEFGRQVTGSPEMRAAVEGLANEVAARVPGAEVEMRRYTVRKGGARYVAHIKHGTDKEEAESGTLLAALMSVNPSTKRTRK